MVEVQLETRRHICVDGVATSQGLDRLGVALRVGRGTHGGDRRVHVASLATELRVRAAAATLSGAATRVHVTLPGALATTSLVDLSNLLID